MRLTYRQLRLAIATLALGASALTTSFTPATARERCTNIDHTHYVADSRHYHHWRHFTTEDGPDGYYVISYLPEHDYFSGKYCERPVLSNEMAGPDDATDPYNTIELIELLKLPNT